MALMPLMPLMKDGDRSARYRTAVAVVAFGVFVLCLLDVAFEFSRLSFWTSLVLLLVAATALGLSRRSSVRTGLPTVLLLLGAVICLGIRSFGYEPIEHRSEESWERIRDREARRLATVASDRFTRLCRETALAAERLARNGTLSRALDPGDAADVSAAFALLAETPLPQAHPNGVPGVTLFDDSLRAVAWTGENHPLDGSIANRHALPEPSVTVSQRGSETLLQAFQPLPDEQGFLSVEVPLAADRRLQNRYLRDYDALSSWAGRSVEAVYFAESSNDEELAGLLASEGNPRWGVAGRDEPAPRLYFALRSDRGRILGLASILGEASQTARLDVRRKLALAAAMLLAMFSAAALVSFLARRPPLLAALLALWAFRLLLHWTSIPLGMGLDLDNPAYYASSLFFGLARSPADFLVTMATLLVSVLLLTRAVSSRPPPDPPSILVRLLAPAAALALLIGVTEVVLDAWVNSNLALAEISFSLRDVPRLTVQLGLLALFLSAALVGRLVVSRAGARCASARLLLSCLVLDGILALAAYAVLSPRGYGDHVVLAFLPLLALHLSALMNDPLARAFSKGSRGSKGSEGSEGREARARRERGLYLKVAGILSFLLAAVVSFYPAVAHFESTTIRNFIEGTVTPAVLQHGDTRTSVLVDTARDIDRMYEEGRLGDLDREDLAFRIWVDTDLSVSPLSSAVEIVDPMRRVVSRFAMGFPALELPEEHNPAPTEWIPAEGRFPGEPSHPGFITARRSFVGPGSESWEIRIRLAADWQNLPFISTTDPYLHLFRAATFESPLRFPHQELELTVLDHQGGLVFQSVGGGIRPPPPLIERALGEPLWWEHPHEGQTHRSYVVSDSRYVYLLSYPEKPAVTYAAELTSWALLAGLSGAVVLLAYSIAGTFRAPTGTSPKDFLHGIVTSFSAKLYVAFVLIALVPIVSLAFFIRGIVIRDLERDVESEGVERAQVAERFVEEIQLSRPPTPLGTAPLTDSVLERVGSLAGVDVDLYVDGELLATSKPELIASGLRHTRAPAEAHRAIVVESASRSIHYESVGTFEYLVVSVPLLLEPWTERGILSVPLASRQAEIDRKIASLNQTVLLAALAFSLAAAGLAYSLARRIAGPIDELTEATHEVAEGNLVLSLETDSKDEIGALFASFNQMTADLKRQRDDLERSKKLEAWAEMARQVAHEIKNPLTPIQLATEHLRRVYHDPSVDFDKVLQDCTRTILEQVMTLRQISMEFSTFASPGPLNLTATDVSELVRSTLEPYRLTVPESVTVNMEAASDLPLVMADARLLRRTLVNLVENALHALSGKGQVRVSIGEASSNGRREVKVVVSDNGVGIDPEMRRRVFEPYFSTRAAGTGLGLAIAKKVVEDHGGAIALESEPGRGTSVTLILPALSGGKNDDGDQ